MKKKPVILIIRDGWGISPKGRPAAEKEGNATLLAHTPFHDYLYTTYPVSQLSGSGEDVGLPEGQMGNSEVGHLNLGAGRIVYQDITRINKSIRDGDFFQNKVLLDLLQKIKNGKSASPALGSKIRNSKLHLIGLLSDGGVHSHLNHLYALVQMARDNGVHDICIHAITDGRDTAPDGGIAYIKALQTKLQELGAGTIVTLIGRYYAMDRDERWERTELAYQLLTKGIGQPASDPVSALEKSYADGVTDEFIKPFVFINSSEPLIQDGDGILFYNFRSDRGRQLSRAWLEPGFSGFDVSTRPKIHFVTMTQYDARYTKWGAQVAYTPQSMENILGKVVSDHGKTQCRLAETEKYPHVTFFFNGGVEPPYPGEDREVVPSPKVATYDLQPEMSAPALTEAVLRRLDSGDYDLIILNFANPDMVGHTGIIPACIQAVETIDICLRRVLDKVLSLDGVALVTADHGNCERLLTDEGKPHTAHTTNLVHFIYFGKDYAHIRLENGILADVAPTLLDLLHIPQPTEMTGHSLIHKC
jgi:2,3-bisphosphoglycerate-independent phosphoglycerate mutase